MKHFIISIIISTLLILPPGCGASSVSGEITMKFDLSGHDSAKPVDLWIPYPVTGEYQEITDVKITGDYDQSAVYTDSRFQTPMLHAAWGKGSKTRTLNFSFAVTRQEVLKRDLPVEEAPWNRADHAVHLAATRLGPVDGEVKKLADTITAGQTTVFGKAKAVYDWTCENTYRNPQTRGCGVGDVYRLLKEPGGKCTDISSIFVALARAAGVPSREVFGIRQGKTPRQDISRWQHCWAEFFLPGYGWVPVDPADVRKMMLKENLTLSDAKTEAYRKYFWGGIDPYRVELSRGRDIVLNPPQSGPPANYLMYPFAQVGDETLDWLDPETFKYKITYRRQQ